MTGHIFFCVDGHDDDPREVHSIPEIRRFYSAFHRAWTYWLFLYEFETDVLRNMVPCCLPSIVCMEVDGQDKVAITYDPLEILQFTTNDLASMNSICERAEAFKERIEERARALFKYFGLPCDAGVKAKEER